MACIVIVHQENMAFHKSPSIDSISTSMLTVATSPSLFVEDVCHSCHCVTTSIHPLTQQHFQEGSSFFIGFMPYVISGTKMSPLSCNLLRSWQEVSTGVAAHNVITIPSCRDHDMMAARCRDPDVFWLACTAPTDWKSTCWTPQVFCYHHVHFIRGRVHIMLMKDCCYFCRDPDIMHHRISVWPHF